MRYFQLLFLLLMINISYAQSRVAGRVAYNDLEKVVDAMGVPTFYLDGELYTGTTFDEYPEGEISREHHFKNGLIEKQLGWYFNGNKERVFSYKDGVPHGKLTSYHRNGETKYYEENYFNGVQDGTQQGWNYDGSKRYEAVYMQGTKLYQLEFEKKGKHPKDDKC